MRSFPIQVLCGLLFALCVTAYVDYTGDQVLRVSVENQHQLEQLTVLSAQYDFWHEPLSVGDHADIHVPKQNIPAFTQWLQSEGFGFSVMIADVGDLIAQQLSQSSRLAGYSSRLDQYKTLAEVEEWIDNIAAEFPDLVTVQQIATSYEGRPIRMLKISTSDANRPAFWIDSGIHSREWVAPAANIYITDRLLRTYSTDPEVTDLLDNMDFYIVPVFNVDGYEYTWTDDRLWRKTRSPNAGSSCVGTDPNRNWDIEWGVVSAGGPCTQTFPGDSAWSEVEVLEVVNFMSTIDNLMGVLAIHAYGQMYMVSYGYTTTPNPDYDEQMAVCNEAKDAIFAVHGQTYRCDSLINLVGANSGSSADYAYEVMGIKYSFGVELRDTGVYGFLLPENQIVPTGEENFEAVIIIAKAALEDFQK